MKKWQLIKKIRPEDTPIVGITSTGGYMYVDWKFPLIHRTKRRVYVFTRNAVYELEIKGN